jgi:hypothetical protein
MIKDKVLFIEEVENEYGNRVDWIELFAQPIITVKPFEEQPESMFVKKFVSALLFAKNALTMLYTRIKDNILSAVLKTKLTTKSIIDYTSNKLKQLRGYGIKDIVMIFSYMLGSGAGWAIDTLEHAVLGFIQGFNDARGIDEIMEEIENEVNNG